MIQTNYETDAKRGKRYVRASVAMDGMYNWCIQSADKPQHDVAQGICDAEELPPEVKAAADAMRGRAFNYVEWPI